MIEIMRTRVPACKLGCLKRPCAIILIAIGVSISTAHGSLPAKINIGGNSLTEAQGLTFSEDFSNPRLFSGMPFVGVDVGSDEQLAWSYGYRNYYFVLQEDESGKRYLVPGKYSKYPLSGAWIYHNQPSRESARLQVEVSFVDVDPKAWDINGGGLWLALSPEPFFHTLRMNQNEQIFPDHDRLFYGLQFDPGTSSISLQVNNGSKRSELASGIVNRTVSEKIADSQPITLEFIYDRRNQTLEALIDSESVLKHSLKTDIPVDSQPVLYPGLLVRGATAAISDQVRVYEVQGSQL